VRTRGGCRKKDGPKTGFMEYFQRAMFMRHPRSHIVESYTGVRRAVRVDKMSEREVGREVDAARK
jgi:hypothetical protein